MNLRTKALVAVLVALNVFQRWDMWRTRKLIDDFADRIERRSEQVETSIVEQLSAAMALVHNENHATSMKDIAQPEEFTQDAQRLLDAMLEVKHG